MAHGSDVEDSGKEKDAFWSGLSDMHPQSLGRRETIKRAAAQRAGFMLASLHARKAEVSLEGQERTFLYDNLVYHAGFMALASTWVEQLNLAHEALDLGDLHTFIGALEAADAAFSQIPALAESYCQGKWKEWYRGCRKLNVQAIAKKTRDVLDLARKDRQ